MIQEVKDAFKNNLPMLKWMDKETRELAKEKVRTSENLTLLCFAS